MANFEIQSYGTVEAGELRTFSRIKKKNLKPVVGKTRVRVLVNGIGCYCRVEDICSTDILSVVEKINRERAKGTPTIGLGTRVGEHNIQVDVI